MSHRTLNPTTSLYGDCRERLHRPRLSAKQKRAADAWMIAYPDKPMPYRALDVYADLVTADFIWDGETWSRTGANEETRHG